jgi:transcriptional regulator with XRE-family HTH domain
MMDANYSEIVERMKRAGGLKNDSAVARRLNVTPQALSNYKKKGRMPAGLMLKFAAIYGLSMDWLLTGSGKMRFENKDRAETRDCAIGMIETAIEGEDEDLLRVRGFSALAPDEMVYVGKLLVVLRAENKPAAAIARSTIDALLKIAKSPARE